MQSKLFRIKLKAGSYKKLCKQVDYMKDKIDQVKFEMDQKGYYWDSVFFEIINDQEYMVVVAKSKDFSSIIRDDNAIETTPSRDVYNQFKDSCWMSAPDVQEALFCFNKDMTFSK